MGWCGIELLPLLFLADGFRMSSGENGWRSERGSNPFSPLTDFKFFFPSFAVRGRYHHSRDTTGLWGSGLCEGSECWLHQIFFFRFKLKFQISCTHINS